MCPPGCRRNTDVSQRSVRFPIWLDLPAFRQPRRRCRRQCQRRFRINDWANSSGVYDKNQGIHSIQLFWLHDYTQLLFVC